MIHIYGNVIPIFANRLVNNLPLQIFGDGEQTRDFINVKDVAMANYLAAVKSEKSEVYNIGSGMSITINKLASLMQDICSLNTNIEYLPARIGEVKHCKANIVKITEELGFRTCILIENGLKEYLNWFRNDR